MRNCNDAAEQEATTARHSFHAWQIRQEILWIYHSRNRAQLAQKPIVVIVIGVAHGECRGWRGSNAPWRDIDISLAVLLLLLFNSQRTNESYWQAAFQLDFSNMWMCVCARSHVRLYECARLCARVCVLVAHMVIIWSLAKRAAANVALTAPPNVRLMRKSTMEKEWERERARGDSAQLSDSGSRPHLHTLGGS